MKFREWFGDGAALGAGGVATCEKARRVQRFLLPWRPKCSSEAQIAEPCELFADNDKFALGFDDMRLGGSQGGDPTS